MILCLLALTHWVVDPTSATPYLPDTEPSDGTRGGVVRIVAAQDEYEPGSFVIRSDVDLDQVQLEVSDLRQVKKSGEGEEEATGVLFPKANLDLRVVKVWYQNRNAWFNYFGDTGFKLCPELLLHDEDLIRVDEKKVANYARIKVRSEKGEVRSEERWINPPRQFDTRQSRLFWRSCETFESMKRNFRDAETLQPVKLEKNRAKQFYLTVHVAKGTPAGLYRGAIKVFKNGTHGTCGTDGTTTANQTIKQSNNQTILSIPVELRVLDFALPEPRAYGDLAKPFRVGFYNYLSFHYLRMRNGDDAALAREQMVSILRNYRAHNVHTFILGDDMFSEAGRFTMDEMRKAGLDPLALAFVEGGSSVVHGNGRDIVTTNIRHGGVDTNVIRRQAAAMTRVFGHRNVMAGYGDEPRAKTIMPMREVWKAYQDWGFKTFIAGDALCFHKTGHIFDWFNQSCEPTDPTAPRNWNAVGAESFAWYANQHVGAEDPSLNRRQNGLGSWLAGYTALCNYALHLGDWNDDSVTYRPMVYAYGIGGGLVDTLQWEGFREGVDDIRYATKLVSLARAALARGEAPIRRKARLTLAWLAEVDRARDALPALRAEMVRRIFVLRDALGHDAELPKIVEQRFAEPKVDIDAELARELAAAKNVEDKAKVYSKYYFGDKAFELLVASNRLAAAAKCAPTSAQALELSRRVVADKKAPNVDRIDRFVALIESDLPFALKYEKDILASGGARATNQVLEAVIRQVRGYRGFYDGRRTAAEERLRIIRELSAAVKKPVPLEVWKFALQARLADGDLKGVGEVCGALGERALPAKGAKGATLSAEDAYLFDLAKALASGQAYDDKMGAKLATKKQLEVLDKFGSWYLRSGDEKRVRELYAFRDRLVAHKPRRHYDVSFSDKPIRAPQDWPAVEDSPMDRHYKGSVEVLVTDVATGKRTLATEAKASAAASLAVVADAWGLHLRYSVADEKAAEIAAGLMEGDSYEIYIAPKDFAHTALMLDVGRETKLHFCSTSYDNANYRRADPVRHPDWHRVQTVFGPSNVTVYVSVSWKLYPYALPKDGAVWDYENLRWARTGDNAWNGTESIHGRSTWGEFVFHLTPAQEAAVLREALFTARAAYLAEKDPNKNGILDFWEDFDIGDNLFYMTRVKPLVDRLDRDVKNVTPAMSDDEVRRIARESLPGWLSIRDEVQRLRTEWLRDYPNGVQPVADRITTLRPAAGPVSAEACSATNQVAKAASPDFKIDGWAYRFTLEGGALKVARTPVARMWRKPWTWYPAPRAVALPGAEGKKVVAFEFEKGERVRIVYEFEAAGSVRDRRVAEAPCAIREFCESHFEN